MTIDATSDDADARRRAKRVIAIAGLATVVIAVGLGAVGLPMTANGGANIIDFELAGTAAASQRIFDGWDAPAPPAEALSPPPPVDWAQRAGGAGDDNASGLATDAAGNLYVTGKLHGTATFGSGPSATTLTGAGGSRNIYVASYLSDGTLRWVVKAGGTGYDEGRDVAVDTTGHVYVTGQFTRTATFSPGPGSVTYTATPTDYSDLFLARFVAMNASL